MPYTRRMAARLASLGGTPYRARYSRPKRSRGCTSSVENARKFTRVDLALGYATINFVRSGKKTVN
jgi:hypothetical protein